MTHAMAVAMIRDAIINHKQIIGFFDGLPREFCPHVLGLNKNGGWSVLGWQFAGQSESKLPAEGGWRCFDLSQFSITVVKPGKWFRGYYNGRGEQHCVKKVDTVVDAEHSAEIRGTFTGAGLRARSRHQLR